MELTLQVRTNPTLQAHATTTEKVGLNFNKLVLTSHINYISIQSVTSNSQLYTVDTISLGVMMGTARFTALATQRIGVHGNVRPLLL